MLQLPLNMLGFDPATQAELDAVNTALGNRATALEAKGLTVLPLVTTTTGTARDVTGIPANAKQIVITLSNVSLSGTASIRLQLGVGVTPTTSGYNSNMSNGTGASVQTSGVDIDWANAAAATHGSLTLTLVDPATNTWAGSGCFITGVTGQNPRWYGVTVPLSGALGMVRVTSSNGTDTLDGGFVSVAYYA